MALVKLGALAQDVRGSLNGTVFSKNKGGAYVRTKVSACQPFSSYSSVCREVFQAATRRYSTFLDAGQHAGWEAFAVLHPVVNRFGDTVQISGLAWFVKVNTMLRVAGSAWIDDAPAEFICQDLGAVAVVCTVTGGALTFTLTPDNPPATNYSMLPRMGLPLWGGRNAQAGDLVDLLFSARAVITSPVNMATNAVKRWPNQVWAVGQRIPWQLAAMKTDTGAQSVAVSGVAVAAAP